MSVDGSSSNPAFSRFSPATNTLYTVTEHLAEEGKVHAYSVNPMTGKLTETGAKSAGGTSTCAC